MAQLALTHRLWQPTSAWRKVCSSPNVDFSKLPEIGGDLLELLPENPPFSINTDFKKTYGKYLGNAARSVAKRLNTVLDNDCKNDSFASAADIRFNDNKNYETEAVIIGVDGKKSHRLQYNKPKYTYTTVKQQILKHIPLINRKIHLNTRTAATNCYDVYFVNVC